MRKIVFSMIMVLVLLTGCTNRYADPGLSTAGDVPGEDHQRWNSFGSASASSFTKGEEGFYYVDSQTDLLTYYDCARQIALPLCPQPECEHDAQGCNAFLPNHLWLSYLQYYHGYLYALGTDQEAANELQLYRIHADGSARENIGTVLSVEGGAVCRALIHRGYLYFSPYGGGMLPSGVNVYRFPLNGKGETELIYTAPAQTGGTMMLQAQGNYLYLHCSHFADSAGTSYTGEIYRYQIHDGEITPVLEGVGRDFALDEQYLYYDNGQQIIAYHMDTGEERVLAEPGMPVYLSCVGGYLCYDNGCGLWISGQSFDGRTITVLDTESRSVLGTIPLEGKSSEFIGTDGESLIALIVRRNGDDFTSVPSACPLQKLSSGWSPWSQT